jgi:hypothetical protein
MNRWFENDRKWGENGFVDYFAGPHIENDFWGIPEPYRYTFVTYCLRTDIWRMYARSGNRAYRDFCEGTTRSFMDNIHMHWNPPSGSGLVRGLFRVGEYAGTGKGLPMYWAEDSQSHIWGSSDFHNYMWLYYLTGERRAKEVIEEYARSVKQIWEPERAMRNERVIMATRLRAQCYEFTLDPELKELTEAYTGLFYDPEAAMHIGNKQDGGSYYKIFSNVRGLIDAWEILGNPRCLDLAMRAAEISWQNDLGDTGGDRSYNPGLAFYGNFLYTLTGEPRYAQAMAISLRQLVAEIIMGNPQFLKETASDKRMTFGLQAERTSLILEADLALDVLARSGADTNMLCSWVGYNHIASDIGNYAKPKVVFRRFPDTSTTLYFASLVRAYGYQYPFDPLEGKAKLDPLPGHEGVRLKCLEPETGGRHNYGYDLIQLMERTGGSGILCIPKDVPAAYNTFEISLPSSAGYILAGAKIPMVLYAPGYWMPSWQQLPPVRYYFNLPKDSHDAQIFFGGNTKLFDPAGNLLGTNGIVNSWVNLPGSKPGLWSFEPMEEAKAVRVRNLPPFFAVGDSNLYFTPEIAWAREPIPEPARKILPGMNYVPGPGSAQTNQAVYLPGWSHIQIPAGLPHPSGDGNVYLPCKEGTIDFFAKPADWDSLDPAARPPFGGDFFKILETKGLELDYCLKPEFYGPGKLRLYMEERGVDFSRHGAIFERDKWAHIAVVWGRGILAAFINGKLGAEAPAKIEGGLLPPMKELNVGRSMIMDELRISDIVRYTADFQAPLPGTEFTLDEHTRALFHFNGSLEGQSYGVTNPPQAKIN